jgi:hypothetical protein
MGSRVNGIKLTQTEQVPNVSIAYFVQEIFSVIVKGN